MAGQQIELDVRPFLKQKKEPFELIMSTVKSLKKEDTLLLRATFKPTPLLGVLKLRGFATRCEQLAPDHWTVTIVHRSRAKELKEETPAAETEAPAKDAAPQPNPAGPASHFLDNRGLEPPTPMMRTLRTLEKAAPGDTVVIHNDRVPVFLIEELKSLGYTHQIEKQPDGTAIVTIHRS